MQLPCFLSIVLGLSRVTSDYQIDGSSVVAIATQLLMQLLELDTGGSYMAINAAQQLVQLPCFLAILLELGLPASKRITCESSALANNKPLPMPARCANALNGTCYL